MKTKLLSVLGCLLIFVCGLLIAKLIHRTFLAGPKGESVTVSVPQVQSGPERVLDDEKLDREFRLKMLVFTFCGGSNTNRPSSLAFLAPGLGRGGNDTAGRSSNSSSKGQHNWV